jgi:hypothetical protein
MKTLATFFVTALLLTGSAWAQTAVATSDDLATTSVSTGQYLGTIRVEIPKTAAKTKGNDIVDELVVWSTSNGARYEIQPGKLQVSGGEPLTRSEIYALVGQYGIVAGIRLGYTRCDASGIPVTVKGESYWMMFGSTCGTNGPSVVLKATSSGSGSRSRDGWRI